MKKGIHYPFGAALIMLALSNSSCSKRDIASPSADESVKAKSGANVQSLTLATVTSKEVYNWHPGHYVLFNDDQDVVTASSTPSGFLGVQKNTAGSI